MYQERFYRAHISYSHILEIAYKESDLLICSDVAFEKSTVYDTIKYYYGLIEAYAKKRPLFLTALSPIEGDPSAPAIVQEMLRNCQDTGIGPFASVAGAIAKFVGNELLARAGLVMIENGGDIFLKINEDITLGVYLGDHFASQYGHGGIAPDRLSVRITKRTQPFGIASSSAYLGHSLNFGKADLVTIIAEDALIADGFATALSNMIKNENDIKKVLERAKCEKKICGVLIAFEGRIYLWGEVQL